ncbi:5155_t:CDS:2, partial [Funneliformis geosporum]
NINVLLQQQQYSATQLLTDPLNETENSQYTVSKKEDKYIKADDLEPLNNEESKDLEKVLPKNGIAILS